MAVKEANTEDLLRSFIVSIILNIILPFFLIWGLQFLGLDVKISLSTWFGAWLVASALRGSK